MPLTKTHVLLERVVHPSDSNGGNWGQAGRQEDFGAQVDGDKAQDSLCLTRKGRFTKPPFSVLGLQHWQTSLPAPKWHNAYWLHCLQLLLSDKSYLRLGCSASLARGDRARNHLWAGNTQLGYSRIRTQWDLPVRAAEGEREAEGPREWGWMVLRAVSGLDCFPALIHVYP